MPCALVNTLTGFWHVGHGTNFEELRLKAESCQGFGPPFLSARWMATPKRTTHQLRDLGQQEYGDTWGAKNQYGPKTSQSLLLLVATG
jgi:hypothetical protein